MKEENKPETVAESFAAASMLMLGIIVAYLLMPGSAL
jgi:hypothetical protein